MTKEGSNNLKMIWKSVEMDHILLEAFAVLIGCVLGLAVVGLTTGAFRDGWFWSIAPFILALFGIPMLIYTLWRILRICRKPGAYTFCRCVLYQPHRSYLRSTMYFTVVVEDRFGDKFPANTHAIFSSHGIIGPFLEDYTNETVTVGYNEETGQVVVIG